VSGAGLRATAIAAVMVIVVACGGDASDDGPDAGADTLEISWVAIPGGDFAMGCSAADESCSEYEAPTHTVTVSAFEMMATEVTQHQYAAWATEHENRFDGCANCPADTVRFGDASAYCAAQGGRLPSESEWEYAARAGGSAVYGCGDDSACLDEVGWFFDNSASQTHPAMAKAANDFGLYDMLGNVWEWVADCWHDDYSGAPPSDGSAWDEDSCTYRVTRGGNYGLSASGLRVSNRQGDYPDIYFVPAPGFRCARDGS
jgi:formylglycine-generating enzyme required for sulfatase activity